MSFQEGKLRQSLTYEPLFRTRVNLVQESAAQHFLIGQNIGTGSLMAMSKAGTKLRTKEERAMTRHTLTFATIFIFLAFELTAFAEPRFVAPDNETELKERLKDLREEYAPYLRSLPEKVDVRKRTSLNGHWKFTFEVKDPPKQDTPPPPAPKWFGIDFNDSTWETTTVPEWRYRTVGHDNSYNREVDQVEITGDNRNTSNICWYRRSFETDKPKDNERLWLRFDGVQWEAQVYLNGEFIGSHRVYYEPFGFDVTDKINAGENTLAVRVINGKVYGEPVWAWTLFPDIRAEQRGIDHRQSAHRLSRRRRVRYLGRCLPGNNGPCPCRRNFRPQRLVQRQRPDHDRVEQRDRSEGKTEHTDNARELRWKEL
jgi:preprotein translocase subunit SecG